MRWYLDLPGPFNVALGGEKRPTIDGVDAADYYEMQQVDSLRRFAVKVRDRGDHKRANRIEKKATKKEKKVLRNYVDADSWERNFWSK